MNRKIICNNCGNRGHLYKNCKKPVTSYGNIVFRLDDTIEKVLMIQRKDSLCYIEFIRGKYDINNIEYIQILIDKCSIKEKEKLLNKNYNDLWCELWLLKENKFNNTDDYKRGETKFNMIQNGILYNNDKITLQNIIDNSKTRYIDSEWEFPKGRRNNNGESNISCAKREFCEETNYTLDDYELIENLQTFNEDFLGENKVNYRYIYYIGILNNFEKKLFIDENNIDQYSEIKDLKWLKKDECIDKTRDYHLSRRKLIKNIFNMINIVKINYSLI